MIIVNKYEMVRILVLIITMRTTKKNLKTMMILTIIKITTLITTVMMINYDDYFVIIPSLYYSVLRFQTESLSRFFIFFIDMNITLGQSKNGLQSSLTFIEQFQTI